MTSGPPPDPGSLSQAEQLFAQYQLDLERGESPDFEALCRRNAKHATELRQLKSDWDRVREFAQRAGLGSIERAPLAEELRSRFGSDVDPAVSLGGAAPGPDSGPSSELLKRLRAHAPANSRYRMLGEVGRGGMGAVLKIWDEDLRRTLAMKVVLGNEDGAKQGSTPSVDTRTLGRFLEEAQVTGQLDHPGIVPVHELGLGSDGRVYFTMRLVKGEDLRKIYEYVESGYEGWNPTRALSVLLKVCEAMSYAHDKGVVHRDLKPANVMVGKYGEVYVMDWGLARVLGQEDRHDVRLRPEAPTSVSVRTERRSERDETPDSPLVTMDGTVVGTPSYMPPEQARGDVEELGPHSDVYAVGAMLYHLLTGETPFVPKGVRASAHTVLMRVLEGPPKPLIELAPRAPLELVAICEKAMERDIARRYPDMPALADDLRAYLERRVVKAYESGTWAETKKWVQRNKPLAAWLVTAVVMLIGGLTSLVFKLSADQLAFKANARALIATAEAERAQDHERLAIQKANDVLSLSAIQSLKDLEERADALWPADPDKMPSYEEWLAQARLLIEGQAADASKGVKMRASLAEHEAKLAEIRLRAKPLTSEEIESDRRASPAYAEWEKARQDLEGATGEAAVTLESRIAELQSSIDERRTWEFENGEDRWWHAQLSKLVSDLRAFTDEGSGGLFSSGISPDRGWGIVKRAEFARTIEERSLTGADAKRRWEEAIASIAARPQYGGLRMTPQLGLLPIGADPESGLWEFAHVHTGEAAVRGGDGKLTVSEATGLVFVLIPGYTFWMGAQRTDASGRNFDPQALNNESPVHEVTLSAYFLSKYEMTQGQWLRMTGRNPSNYGPSNKVNDHQHDLTHPVEQVTWTGCMELMEQLGLQLPSEAQWENGCRAGTNTPWWTGVDRESLRGKVNLADQTAKGAGAPWSAINDWPDLEDGWVVHAPVGSLAANPYGLHEVHGNVWEWCRDGYDGYSDTVQSDPGTPRMGAGTRVIRGGSFINAASNARSADRLSTAPEYQDTSLGLRPARASRLSASRIHPPGK